MRDYERELVEVSASSLTDAEIERLAADYEAVADRADVPIGMRRWHAQLARQLRGVASWRAAMFLAMAADLAAIARGVRDDL